MLSPTTASIRKSTKRRSARRWVSVLDSQFQIQLANAIAVLTETTRRVIFRPQLGTGNWDLPQPHHHQVRLESHRDLLCIGTRGHINPMDGVITATDVKLCRIEGGTAGERRRAARQRDRGDRVARHVIHKKLRLITGDVRLRSARQHNNLSRGKCALTKIVGANSQRARWRTAGQRRRWRDYVNAR